MRIPVVRFGDSTTTGGKALAVKGHISDKGKKIALHGEHATCGNCKGSWPMFGTGKGINDHRTQVVIERDRVLCPCGKNRVIAGDDVGCFIHKHPGASNTTTQAESSRAAQYDEQFTLLDEANRPLANMRYRIVVNDERVITGTTNASGQTERVATQRAANLKLQVEK